MPSATRAYASAWLLTLAVAATPFATSLARAADPVASTQEGVTPTSLIDAALSSPEGSGNWSDGVPPAPSGLQTSRCEWPDAASLQAVLPVATDSGSHASGVVYAHGRVLTAAHAVSGGGRFFVRTGADFRPATLVMVDHEKDLAVLSVDTRGIQPLPLAGNDPLDHDPVWAVGFPRARARELSSGFFQTRRDGALHTSAGIDAGQSGGGLLGCSRGRYHLAGMLRGYGAYLSGDRYVKLENHSVSVAATTIQRFLADYR